MANVPQGHKSDRSSASATSKSEYSADKFQVDLGRQMTLKSLQNIDVERRILIVDDEPYNLMGNRIILNSADTSGCIDQFIDQAVNGLEAVKAVKNAAADGTFQYGLILMDCSMPIMDGYEATE